MVSINVTGKVSGTFNAAQSAADRVQSASTIEVLDSGNASIGQGLVAIYAAELAAKGFDAAHIVAAVRKMIPLTRTYALIGSLDYAVRGGRVKPAVKSIANVLGLSPVLASHCGWSGRACGHVVRSPQSARQVDSIHHPAHEGGQPYRIGIGHANAETEAHDLLEQLRRAHPQIESAFVMPVGGTLTAHGGPGTLVVGVRQPLLPRHRFSR